MIISRGKISKRIAAVTTPVNVLANNPFFRAKCAMLDDDLPPVEMPITGELDLHTFHPRDLGSLLPDYLAECQKRGILSVRVIHGKGTGALREGVHRLLPKLPMVESWTWPAAERFGGWGATWVRVKAIQSS